jgi:hypothetical protein
VNIAQVVEHQPSKCKALSSNPRTIYIQKKIIELYTRGWRFVFGW